MGKAIGFLVVLGLMGLSSWLTTRKARGILGRSLGREIQEGEETSLRAWMAVPDAKLGAAAQEMSTPNAAESALGALGTVGRTIKPYRASLDDKREPYSHPNSIR